MAQVGSVMVPHPYTIGGDQPISVAAERMRAHGIRHLPVLAGGRLVGLISDRDVRLVESVADAERVRVEDAMSPEPYCARPETSLREVVARMHEHKLGSVLITDEHDRLLGIFTSTDALRLLVERL
ncbi:Hypothetical protein I5071_61120 [Sandaracinus amylolyticus]|nr:Hypothetical protein I5071_61120 [Sandaracinus amylolyticus]